jgi:hypothetical protein
MYGSSRWTASPTISFCSKRPIVLKSVRASNSQSRMFVTHVAKYCSIDDFIHKVPSAQQEYSNLFDRTSGRDQPHSPI